MIVTNLKQFKYPGMSLEKLNYMKSFDFDINIITGGRSNMKSSTVQIDSIKDFMEKGETAVRLIRWEEMRKRKYMDDWWQPYVVQFVRENYNNANIEYRYDAYWFVWRDDKGKITDKKKFMKTAALSTPTKFKSMSFGEDCTRIIFDEFVPDDGRYLENEYELLTTFISTVNRNRPTGGLKVYMIGNMVSVDNPYFEFFDIDPYELTVSNIYDVSGEEGTQRVGVYLVESVHKTLDTVPRILKTKSGNVQETIQDEYIIPKNIISISDVFLYMMVYKKEEFKQRFKMRYIVDVSDLDEHKFYIVFYVDKYNNKRLYAMTSKLEKSDIYVAIPDNILEQRSTHTVVNSCRALPVFRDVRFNEIKYVDRVARTEVIKLIDNDLMMN